MLIAPRHILQRFPRNYGVLMMQMDTIKQLQAIRDRLDKLGVRL